MEGDPKAFLWDAREAAALITQFTAGKSFTDYDRDKLVRSAVERQFEIIGEALSNLAKTDPASAAKLTELRDVIAFRNILVHGYARPGSTTSASGVLSKTTYRVCKVN